MGAALGVLFCVFLLHPSVVRARSSHESVAAAAGPAPTLLELAQRSSPARYGSAVTLKAKLTSAGAPLGGRDVSLYEGAALVATSKTNGTGVASFSLKARRSAAHQARFVPSSPEDVVAYLPATSPAVSLAVVPVVSLAIESPLRARRKAVAIPGASVRLRATVTPYSAGAQASIGVTSGSRQVRLKQGAVRKHGFTGRFTLSFKPHRRGSYVVRAQQQPTAELGAGRSAARHLLTVSPHAGPGAHGPAVRALQQRLSALGYLVRVNGYFGSGTGRAVLAFRKVNGMSRVSAANRAVFRKLARGRGGFHVRYPKAGKHVEFDWSRQVLVLARGARPVKIVHASSGKPSTPTVFGHFHVYSKTAGFNAKGMYYSNYFVGGYAIHGYAEVPPYAASHGCIRIPIPSAISVYRWIALGYDMFVYR
jgi:hypothetical protein